MKLQSLEMFGFKSFADRTGFEFDSGLTVLVGPNGCGKSNVVDALKWVLGEQRPTSLRGKEMMDVLFNGTSRRKALGLAEVSVSFDNSCHTLPVDFEEVVVTRRLYRDGGGEFLINKTPCRLRDIRELFMDTGTGVESYSVMEQGKIDALLRAGPKDRRAIFDEASGISKYKARRREAERKLEKVVANLERLQDVLDLTLKRERSVKIQAGRARRYQEMTEVVRGLRLKLALHRYHGLLAERQEAIERIEELGASEREIGVQLRALGDEIRADETGLETRAARLREVEARQAEAEATHVASRERIESSRRLSGELEERMARDAKLVERSDEILETLRARGEACAEEGRVAEAELAAGTGRLEEAETRCREARIALEGTRKEREAVRQESLRALSAVSDLENRRARQEADAEGLDARLGRLEARLEETRREEERLAKQAADAELATASLTTRLDEEAEGLRRREEGVTVAERELEELRSSVEELDREVAAARSRREVLVKLQSSREGVSSGVKAVLAAAGSSLSGVKGVVADYLEVGMENARAVEALLGDRAEAVITETLDDALTAIEYLREGNRGRAIFLPLERVEDGGAGADGGWLDRQSLPIWAQVSADLVRSRNGCGNQLMRALFNDAVVVEGTQDARQLLGGNPRMRIVTGGGDLFDPAGLVSGGEGENAGGLVSRNAEIRELAGIVQNLQSRRDTLEEERQGKSRVLADLRRELDESRTRLAGLREARAQRQSEVTRFFSERDRLTEAIELDARDRDACVEDRERRRTVLEELTRELIETQKAEGDLRARGVALSETADASARVVAEAEEARTDRRIAIARATERREAAIARGAAVDRELREAQASRAAAIADRERCEERRRVCEEDGEAARLALDESERVRNEAGRRISALRREAEEARQELRQRRDRSDALRQEQESYQQNLQEFRLRESESRVRLESLIDRVSEECGADVAETHAAGYEEPQDVDWEALEAEIRQVREKLDRLGHVNLDAIDELEELQEKSTFLQTQKDDLTSARESLIRAIREINERSRTQFLETFAAVQEGFRTTFRKLFGGGRAEVSLEDESDPLECGIEIVAKPPGKELRTIGLLSGGERTMAAVALMFAFFGARPTPFVVLDEVDAALDESNIDRFLGLVREYADRSQFIVISHSRRTMSMADSLYGVTMAETGISRKMAMKLEDAEDAVEDPGEKESLVVGAETGV